MGDMEACLSLTAVWSSASLQGLFASGCHVNEAPLEMSPKVCPALLGHAAHPGLALLGVKAALLHSPLLSLLPAGRV